MGDGFGLAAEPSTDRLYRAFCGTTDSAGCCADS